MKKIVLQSISKEDTILIKGIAIILIVLHNYYKWINPVTGENEFGFSLSHSIKSYIFLRSDPLELINVLFNFFGHYGVQAFIFISAYGLTKSWQARKTSYGRYILHRLDRIYPSLLLASLIFVLFYSIKNGGELPGLDVIGDLGIQLSLLANFIPGKVIAITGPWWFYSMIFQFYLLFPFFMWIFKKTGVTGLVFLAAAGYAFIFFLFDPLEKLSLNTQFYLPGHLPVFCLGIFVATRKEIKIPWWTVVFASAVFIGGNLLKWLWPFTFLSVALLIVLSAQSLFSRRTKKRDIHSVFSFFGSVSMYLFACHGFLRGEFLSLANRLNSPFAALLIGLIFLLFSAGVAFCMKQIEQLFRDLLYRAHKRKYRIPGIILSFALIGIGLFVISDIESRTGRSDQMDMHNALVEFYDFEETERVYPERYSDSLYFKGKASYYMPAGQSFTVPMEIDFDSVQIEALSEISTSAMIFTEDTLAEGHIVLEIYDKPTDYRLVWTSEVFNPSTENYRYGKWFMHQLNYRIPHDFLKSNYLLKVYLWNNSQGGFFIDNLELTFITRKN